MTLYPLVKRGRFFWVHGPIHRRANDIDRGLARAGVYHVMLSRLFEANVMFGPYNGSAFFRMMQEAAEEAAQAMTPDDPLLVFLWKHICSDFGWAADDEVGRDARERYIARLPTCRIATCKPKRCAVSKWLSIRSHMMESDRWYHTKLLLLCVLAAVKKWSPSFEHFFMPSRRLAEAAEIASAAGAASSSTTLPPSTAAGGAARGKGRGKQKPSDALAVHAKREQMRSQLAALLKTSVNSLHVCARVMADPNLVEDSRLIIVATEHLAREHTHCIKSLTSPRATFEWYSAEASWAWLATLKDMVRALGDLAKLGRVGFTTDFTANMRKNLLPDDDVVHFENCRAEKLFKTTLYLIAERASSGLRYSMSYPFRMAPIGGDLGAEADSALLDYAKMWEAFVAARKYKMPSIVDLVQRCSLTGRAMEDMTRYARAADFKACEVLKQRVYKVFSSLLNEKLIEDTNKQLREDETRGAANKDMKFYSAWDSPVSAGLFDQHRRCEIDCSNHGLPLPTQRSPTKGLWKFEGDGDPSGIGFKEVLTSPSMLSWSAQSIKRQPHIDSLIMDLHRQNAFEKAADAWRSAIIPTVQLILQRPTVGPHKIWMCLDASPYGCLAWPVKRVAKAGCALDLTAPKLEIVHVYSFDDISVVPFEVKSPLEAWLQGHMEPQQIQIYLHHGAPVDVLQFQAKRGFGGVTEKHLQMLAADRELDAGDAVAAIDQETHLAMVLVKDILPDIDEDQLAHALMQRDFASDADLASDPWRHLDGGDLAEMVSPSDKKTVHEYALDVEKKLVRRTKLVGAIKAAVALACAPRAEKKGKVPKKKALTSKPGAAGCDGRWWSSVVGDLDWVLANKPGPGRVIVDDWNGRYRISYPGVLGDRSISWTKRSVQLAAAEAVRQLWEWHTQATGQEGPSLAFGA